MQSHIFIIEDIKEMSDLIKLYLEAAGFTVSCFATANEALVLLKSTSPDLILLDLNLPGMSGYEFLKVLKSSDKKTVPVIIVSARDADEDIISGLGLGANEFVTKPFSPRVLVARVQANLRTHLDNAKQEEHIDFGDYTLLLDSCVLKKGEQKIKLSTKEYDVLSYLVKHPNQNLTPDRIYSEVWNNQYGDISAVAVYVQRLRKKLETNLEEPRFIKTVFGMGYRFEPL